MIFPPVIPRHKRSLSLEKFKEIILERASIFERYIFMDPCTKIEKQKMEYAREYQARYVGSEDIKFAKRKTRQFDDHSKTIRVEIARRWRRNIVTRSCCLDGINNNEGWIPIGWRREVEEAEPSMLVEDVYDSDESDVDPAEFYWENAFAADSSLDFCLVSA